MFSLNRWFGFLFAEHLFNISDLFLRLACDLIGIAFGLQPGIANRFAGFGLEVPHDVFRGAFIFISGAGFHAPPL
jgi:hypothetical protein